MSEFAQIQSSTNPLAKHFRQPAIYIQLTSKGKFWKDGALELPTTGKIPVYPMTTRDEITLRTPDALVNGTSVVDVIHSCCPNIKDAWEMPSVDVDSTLIAIRIASYGQTMGITSKCPHCSTENDYDVNLSAILDAIQMPNYDEPVDLGHDLSASLKPLSYRQINESGNVNLEEERLIQTISNPDMPDDERKSLYDQHIKRMIEINLDNVTNCTNSITTSDGQKVTNPAHIREFYANSEGVILRKVQDRLKEISEIVSIKPVNTECSDCSKIFDITINFDYASFFDQGF